MKAVDIQKEFSMNGVSIRSYCSASEEELMMVLEWRNSPEIRRHMFTTEEILLEDHLAYSRELKDREDLFYFIVLFEGEPLGAVSITDIDYESRSTYLGIYARPDNPRKGAGTILMKVICRIVFDIMKFENLKLKVLETNERATGFYYKFGFNKIGEEDSVLEMEIKADRYREIYG